MTRKSLRRPHTLLHILALAACLPLLGGCLSIRSFDPKVPEPKPEDAFVTAETESGDQQEGMDVALTSSMPNGHFVASSQVTVIRPDARREAAIFESKRGAKSFEDHVAERYARGDAVRERNQGGIPLFYSAEEKRMLSENAFYNEQLQAADVDRNGVLSDAEIRAYAR